MTAARAIKIAFSAAWVLSGASLLMISDDYPSGYERLVGYAVILFVAGVLISIGGFLAGALWQRGKISAWWMAVGGLHIVSSLIVVMIGVLGF